MTSSVRHVTVDAVDPYSLATFWASALGGRLQDEDAPGDAEALVTAPGLVLLFEARTQPGPPKTHLDLQPADSRDEEVRRLQALGATVRHDRTRPDGSGWVVLADPEGNEFCVERSSAERGTPEPVDTGERPLPPLHTGDERTMLLGMLDWYRDGVLRKVDGLSSARATRSPLRTGTTPAGLLQHLAFVEDHWLTSTLAGHPLPEPWASAPFEEDPDWEFHSATDLAVAVEHYRSACERSRGVMDGEVDLDRVVQDRGREVSVRFVLLHLVEETARHLGHLDVLRELADGVTGE